MAFDFNELKDKVSKKIDETKNSETFKKVTDSTKELADKAKNKVENIDTDKIIDKSQDFYDDTKRTIRRLGEEIDNKIDKLKK